MRVDGSRADARGNRARLVEAAGRLLARAGSFTLTELADEAEVSRSTTYRNFSSPAAATDAFVDSFLTDFEAEVAALASDGPVEHLADICHAWAVLVEQHSQALVHVRSTEGFLSRVRRGDPIIGRIHGLMRSAIVEALAAGELPGSDRLRLRLRLRHRLRSRLGSRLRGVPVEPAPRPPRVARPGRASR